VTPRSTSPQRRAANLWKISGRLNENRKLCDDEDDNDDDDDDNNNNDVQVH